MGRERKKDVVAAKIGFFTETGRRPWQPTAACTRAAPRRPVSAPSPSPALPDISEPTCRRPRHKPPRRPASAPSSHPAIPDISEPTCRRPERKPPSRPSSAPFSHLAPPDISEPTCRRPGRKSPLRPVSAPSSLSRAPGHRRARLSPPRLRSYHPPRASGHQRAHLSSPRAQASPPPSPHERGRHRGSICLIQSAQETTQGVPEKS